MATKFTPEMLIWAMHQHGDSYRKAQERLGIAHKTLWNYVKGHNRIPQKGPFHTTLLRYYLTAQRKQEESQRLRRNCDEDGIVGLDEPRV